MRLVLPHGAYHAGNTGDEATLNGFACLLREHGLSASGVRVASARPTLMSRAEPAFRYFGTRAHDPRRWWAMRNGAISAIVGATPIHDANGDGPLADLGAIVREHGRRNTPLAFVGVGVERLHHEKHRELIAHEFAPHVCHWSPRSTRGRERLLEYGVPNDRITLAADLAWLMEPVERTFGERCLGEWGMNRRQPFVGVGIAWELFRDAPALTDALAAALDALIDEADAQILFFTHDVTEAASLDLQVARAVMARMKHPQRAWPIPNMYFTPRQFMSLIGCCKLTVSTRYHFCVYSAVQRVPFLAIQNTDKVLDLCADMGWALNIAPPDIDGAVIVGHLRRLLGDSASPAAALAESVRKMRDLASRNVASVRALMRN